MNKTLIRHELRSVRQALSAPRRQEAEERLLLTLPALLAPYKMILSYASFFDEIDLSSLNRFLASEGRLILPKIEGNTLLCFKVTDLKEQLTPNSLGIYEPIPSYCEEISKEKLDLVLVPGLGFDGSNHRIGYGKGYYDRFLASISPCPSIGLGFREQRVAALPVTSNDTPLSEVYLY